MAGLGCTFESPLTEAAATAVDRALLSDKGANAVADEANKRVRAPAIFMIDNVAGVSVLRENCERWSGERASSLLLLLWLSHQPLLPHRSGVGGRFGV